MRPGWRQRASQGIHGGQDHRLERQYREPQYQQVVPEQGLVSGGDTVTIKGGGFQPGKTQVEVWAR